MYSYSYNAKKVLPGNVFKIETSKHPYNTNGSEEYFKK